MSGKLKLLLGVLALGTLVSVWYGSALIKSSSAPNFTSASVLTAADLGGVCARDTDKDGLSDCEETFWSTDAHNPDTDGDGFLDGEETLSGHSPTVKGPNDFTDKSKNLTQRTTELLAGGISAGALNPSDPQYSQDADKLVAAILEDYQNNTAITLDNLNLAGDSAQEKSKYVSEMAWAIRTVYAPTLDDARAFLATVEDLPADDISGLINNPKRLSAFVSSAHKLAQNSSDRALKIAAIATPNSFAIQQKNAIRVLRMLEKQYQLAGNIKNDPLQGITAIQAIATLGAQTVPAFIADLAEQMQNKLSKI